MGQIAALENCPWSAFSPTGRAETPPRALMRVYGLQNGFETRANSGSFARAGISTAN
ncbi:hypothetical protein AUSSIE_31 [Sinorhizobium phage Aussie]|nr:hypothetical protein AUSSIE_31 [Sinorhizobium phage Aussie]